MRILEIILHRYKRLGFSGIQTIRYTPEEDIQIIIGSNGSGKSSFMNEINPLPPNSADMLLGGYKTSRVSHNGKEYRLHSSYEKHNRHSFIEIDENGNEIELNAGGTSTAQKMLIEKIFGLTTDIIKILIGRTTFTSMAPIKRRDWILKLSGNDLEFAMRLFNTVKNAHREAATVEKHCVKRLAEETTDVADRERIVELEQTVTRLTEGISLIMSQRENRVPSTATIHLEMTQLLQEFNACAAEVLTLHLSKPECLTTVDNNLHALSHHITTMETRLEMLGVRLNELYNDKDKIMETLETLSKNGVGEVDELSKVTTSLEKEIKLLVADNPLYEKIDPANIEGMIGAYNSCKGLLFELLSTMTDNTSLYFTKEKVSNAREKLAKLQNYEHVSKQRADKLRHQLEHYNTAHDTVCPKCDHTFRPGMVGFNPQETQVEIDRLTTDITNAAKEIKELNDYLEEAREYTLQVRSLRRLIEDNQILSPLWEVLVEEGLYKVAPISHLPTAQQFVTKLENCLAISELQKKLHMNRIVLDNAKKMQSNQDIYSAEYVIGLDGKIAAVITEIDQLRNNLGRSKVFQKEVERATRAISRAFEIRDMLVEKYDIMLASVKNRALSEAAQIKQVALATTQSTLNQIARHEAVVAELENERKKAADNTENLATIMKALSPVDGLISKYIQNFINVFIEDVNAIIAEIWTSNLEVMACGVDSNDVTCKFPLSVLNGYLITPDISESSDGQRDIINLAFRLVVGKYLNLEDFPLYVDELAPTLDEVHRVRLTRYLNGLMEAGIYNQMFMISHYASTHFAFANAQVFMLDARNIVNKPKEYNKHVSLVYDADMMVA